MAKIIIYFGLHIMVAGFSDFGYRRMKNRYLCCEIKSRNEYQNIQLKLLLKARKQALNSQLNTFSNPREALIQIDSVVEELPDFTTAPTEVTALLTSSITRQLCCWLAEQKEIYKTLNPR